MAEYLREAPDWFDLSNYNFLKNASREQIHLVVKRRRNAWQFVDYLQGKYKSLSSSKKIDFVNEFLEALTADDGVDFEKTFSSVSTVDKDKKNSLLDDFLEHDKKTPELIQLDLSCSNERILDDLKNMLPALRENEQKEKEPFDFKSTKYGEMVNTIITSSAIKPPKGGLERYTGAEIWGDVFSLKEKKEKNKNIIDGKLIPCADLIIWEAITDKKFSNECIGLSLFPCELEKNLKTIIRQTTRRKTIELLENRHQLI